MNDTFLRVLFARYPPFAFSDCVRFPQFYPTKECPYPGFCVEVIRAIAKRLGLHIKPIVLDYEIGKVNWGQLRNGSYTGMLGLIANGYADTACMFYRSSTERLETFDFSTSLYKTRTGVAVRHLEHAHEDGFWDNLHPTHGFWDFFHPFSSYIWVALALLILLQCVVGVAVTKAESFLVGLQARPSDIAFLVIRLQLRQQVVRMPALKTAGKAWIVAFSLVQCMLVTTLYQSLFRASTILRQKHAPFTSYEDVVSEVETGRYRVTEDTHGDWFTNEIENSGEGYYERLRNAVARYPVLRMSSANESLECVRAGRCIKFFQDDAQTRYMALTSDCDISFVYDGFPSMEARMPFLKGSQLTENFNDAIELERIEISRIQRKYYETMYGRIQKNNCRAVVFKLLPNIGLTAIFLCGVFIAVILFACELRGSIIVAALKRCLGQIKRR